MNDVLHCYLNDIPEGEEGDAKEETKSASELGYKGDEGVGPGLLLDSHLRCDKFKAEEKVPKLDVKKVLLSKILFRPCRFCACHFYQSSVNIPKN